MIKQLQVSDFKRVELGEGMVYLSWTDGSVEVCLEPCLNGFDVAIYDTQQQLLQDKVCMDWKHSGEEGVALVNEMIELMRNTIEMANLMLIEHQLSLDAGDKPATDKGGHIGV